MLNGFLPLGGSRIWTPKSPGNLLAWYDAKIVSTLAGNVTRWDDQSGNSNIFLDPTGGSGGGPNYNSTGWDGTQPAVIFNSAGQYLINTTGLSTYPSTGGVANPLSIFMIIESNTVTSSPSVFFNWDDNNTITSVASYALDGSQHLEAAYGGEGLKVTGSITATGAKKVIGFTVGTDGYFNSYVNSSLDMVNVGPRVINFSGSLVRVLMGLGWTGGISAYSGKIAEILIYSKKLTTSDYFNFYDYAKLKWNGL